MGPLPPSACRDGESHNLSWNCGAEGPTESPAVNSLRQRQMRNMLAALLVAHGVPMLYMGDEYGHRWAGAGLGMDAAALEAGL